MDIDNDKFLVVDGGAGQHLYFNSLSNGQFEIYVGGTLRATVPNLGANRWHWIDVELFVDDANGHCIVNINGVEYVNITGTDTRNAGNANVDRVRLGGLTPTIHGVGIKAVARKDGGGARSLRLGAKSGATTGTTDNVLGTTYAVAEHIMELNPDDNEAWAVADIDALLAHVEVVQHDRRTGCTG